MLVYEQVADLSMLRAETHKFESHYIDNLVGKINKMPHLCCNLYIIHLFHLVVSNP